jgi:hypothetical protein
VASATPEGDRKWQDLATAFSADRRITSMLFCLTRLLPSDLASAKAKATPRSRAQSWQQLHKPSKAANHAKRTAVFSGLIKQRQQLMTTFLPIQNSTGPCKLAQTCSRRGKEAGALLELCTYSVLYSVTQVKAGSRGPTMTENAQSNLSSVAQASAKVSGQPLCLIPAFQPRTVPLRLRLQLCV